MSTRDEAVLLLNALASRRCCEDWRNLNFFGMSEQLDIGNDALSLARDCFDNVPSLHMCVSHSIDETQPQAFELECAQAALLVAEGWQKGDAINERPLIMQQMDAGVEAEDFEGVN